MGQHSRADIGSDIRGKARSMAGQQSVQRFSRNALVRAIGHAFATAGLATAAMLPAFVSVSAQAADASTAAMSAPASGKAYDIPAGPLEAALNRFGREAGILLSFPTELTAGLQSKSLRGSYSVRQALPLLLQGTGLAAVAQADGSYTLVKRPQQAGQGLSMVTVSASADWLGAPTPEAAKKHPGARTVVTSQELTESGARTVEDSLRTVPGVRVLDESGTGILPNIGVRGLNPLRSEQVLVLVDGMPISLAPYGQTGLSLFPLTLNSVEAIDVARGGIAVHYGPNNVGGVVNFVTKRIPSKASFTAKETLSVAGNGRVLSDTYLRAGGFVNDRLGLQAQANIIEGNAERDHSATTVNNLMLDADWLVTDNADIKAGLQYYKTENEMPGALTPQSYEQNRDQSTRPLDRFDGDTLRGHVVYNQYFDNGAELSWTNFAHHSNRQFFFGNSSNADTPSTLEMSAPREFWVYGSEPRFTFNIDGGIKQKIAVGARYMREEVDYLVNSRNVATNAFAVARDWRFENDAAAAYVSDTFSLLDDKLKATPGIRYEQIDSYRRDNKNGLEGTNATRDWLPGVDVGYQASDALFLFANFHKSLRPVQFTQVTFGGTNLAAEHAKNYEAGVRLSPIRNIDAGLTAFRFDFDNKLEFVAAEGAFRNLGKARHQGIEAELAWRPVRVSGLEFKTAYTYVDTEQLSGQFEGNELPLAPQHQVNLQTNYRSGAWNWNVNGLYQSTAFSDGANTVAENASGSVGRIPSYSVWNAQVTHDFSWNGTRMKAAFAVNNLFDRDYYFRGVDFSQGRMPAPGRAALVSLQMDM